MRLDFSHQRLLAVVAHPDDAEILCAGTLARARADSAQIGICVMCKGDKGQPAKRIKNLAAVRRREMTAAAKLLGARLFWAGYGDATLLDSRARRMQVVDYFRRFKPTLVLTHSPLDYHADHRAASAIAEAATWLCASRGNRTATTALATAPEMWFMDTVNMLGFEPGFFVDISAHLEIKQQMLRCHRSQLERSGDRDLAPLLDSILTQARARGLQSGVDAAEAFCIHRAFKRTGAW